MAETINGPVINGPFDPPEQYVEVGPSGPMGILVHGRRPRESWIPVPAARKGRASTQGALDFDVTGERREPNTLINDIRREVERWRLTYSGVTPITRKLLKYWADPARGHQRVLFCQREAAEIAICLAEVAGRDSSSRSDWRVRSVGAQPSALRGRAFTSCSQACSWVLKSPGLVNLRPGGKDRSR